MQTHNIDYRDGTVNLRRGCLGSILAGYAGAAISFFRSAGRSSNNSVVLPVELLDGPVDDDLLFVFAKPLTASRRLSGSTVLPVHGDLMVTSWSVLGRPRPSFLAVGQLSVPGIRHGCETSLVPLSPPMIEHDAAVELVHRVSRTGERDLRLSTTIRQALPKIRARRSRLFIGIKDAPNRFPV